MTEREQKETSPFLLSSRPIAYFLYLQAISNKRHSRRYLASSQLSNLLAEVTALLEFILQIINNVSVWPQGSRKYLAIETDNAEIASRLS